MTSLEFSTLQKGDEVVVSAGKRFNDTGIAHAVFKSDNTLTVKFSDEDFKLYKYRAVQLCEAIGGGSYGEIIRRKKS